MPAASSKPMGSHTVGVHAGRRLLQRFYRSTVGGMTINSVAMTNTQSAIRAAVDGRMNAAEAAALGLQAQEVSSTRCFNCNIYGPGGAAAEDYGRH